MAVVEIQDVAYAPRSDAILAHIDAPTSRSGRDTHDIKVVGWAVGRHHRVTAIAFAHETQLLRTVPLSQHRPDVSQRLRQDTVPERCGFETMLGVVQLPPEFELRLEARLENSRAIPIALIRGRHRGIHGAFEPKLRPLLVTMIARVGSSWLMKLLMQHPAIVAHDSPPYEIRAATYWMQMLRVLAEPANHAQSSPFAGCHSNPWTVGHHPYYTPPVTERAELQDWFGRVYSERLAAFCISAIESFYENLANVQSRAGALYFAEKSHPDWVPWALRNVYPQVREILLVRDFRDMLCSILAFNKKRGYASFGRENYGNDEDFARRLGMDSQRILQAARQRANLVHVVRYEDLILSPEQTLTAVLDYLGLSPTPQAVQSMMQQAAEKADELEHHRTMGDGAASIGRWQQDLPPALRSVCQDTMGEVLSEFGYAGV
jgi:hypothetical protein